MRAGHRAAVRRRAGFRCEYCLLPEAYAPVMPFQIEHIVARQHRGSTSLSNLALACHHCNLHKGPNLTSIDPLTRRVVPLFNPRRMKWDRHFRWEGPYLIGRTPTGRATVEVLQMNHEDRVELRRALVEESVFPQS